MQSLLILCQCADCHSPYVPNALSALWIRLGTAIRMAQDLGLHRAEAVKTDIETRRRVWGACVITDRWYVSSFVFFSFSVSPSCSLLGGRWRNCQCFFC